MKVKVEKLTNFKLRPLMSIDLQPQEKFGAIPGEIFEIESCKRDRNKHWRIEFDKPKQGSKVWFAYENHVRIEYDRTDRPLIHVLNNVPYKSQLDNQLNPTGACNVTSIAMCLAYFGVQAQGEQLEDKIYRYMERQGLSRHSPQDLAQVVRDYGKKDDFTVWGTFERCRDHIAAGNPCVIHGYFTSFGHIIVLVGYDDKGFIVHDPYGEWFSSGYRTDLSGEFLHYSYGLIQRTCIPDGQFWVHYISDGTVTISK